MRQHVVTVVGGSGFVGGYVVRALVKAGYTVRVLCRHPSGAAHLKSLGEVGQVVIEHADMADPMTLAGKIEGSYAVVNLVGLLFEQGSQRFTEIHVTGAEALANRARIANLPRLIHFSALGVDRAETSRYARTKLEGERRVLNAFPKATIFRPSVVFGPEDHFFNQFARMAKISPALPLIGGGHTRFQPIYAGDLGEAVIAALRSETAAGKIYELGGPKIYSFKEILTYILEAIGRKRWLAPLPRPLASVIGSFAQWLPRPPLTRDQVRLLAYDNVIDPNALHLRDLGVTPTAVEAIVPAYLARYRTPNAA